MVELLRDMHASFASSQACLAVGNVCDGWDWDVSLYETSASGVHWKSPLFHSGPVRKTSAATTRTTRMPRPSCVRYVSTAVLADTVHGMARVSRANNSSQKARPPLPSPDAAAV